MFAASLGLGVLVGVIVAGFWRKQRPIPVPLPPPGGPPENRGEAVRRVLKHLQRKTIAELEEGSAAVIVGTVHEVDGVERLTAPISGTSCLGYHLDVRRAVLAPNMWFVQVHDRARCVKLEVRDATGSVLVEPEGLELAITDGPIGRWDPPLPPPIAAVVPPAFHGAPVTVEEGLLQPGATLLVCGVVATEQLATDYRDGKQRFVLRALATFPLVASTDPDLLTQGVRPIAPEELHRR